MNNKFLRLFSSFLLIMLSLIGCTSSNKTVSIDPVISQKEPIAVGDIQYGISSYYAEKFHGRSTANGEIYDIS